MHGGTDSIPGWGAKILQASQQKKKTSIKQKPYCYKLSKDFKNKDTKKSLKKESLGI